MTNAARLLPCQLDGSGEPRRHAPRRARRFVGIGAVPVTSRTELGTVDAQGWLLGRLRWEHRLTELRADHEGRRSRKADEFTAADPSHPTGA